MGTEVHRLVSALQTKPMSGGGMQASSHFFIVLCPLSARAAHIPVVLVQWYRSSPGAGGGIGAGAGVGGWHASAHAINDGYVPGTLLGTETHSLASPLQMKPIPAGGMHASSHFFIELCPTPGIAPHTPVSLLQWYRVSGGGVGGGGSHCCIHIP